MLQASGLKKTYTIAGRKQEVLGGIDLRVEAGEVVSITGKSGCGKTTLLRVFAGIAKPDRGEVFLNGEAITRVPDRVRSRIRNREIGFIFQTFRLLEQETAIENVLLPAKIRGRADRDTVEYAYELMGKLNIYRYRKSRAALLSGGQKQRLAIARALINRPSLILADEPTANLDSNTSEEIFNILKSQGTGGRAVVVVTHKESMHSRSDSLYRMDAGIIREVK